MLVIKPVILKKKKKTIKSKFFLSTVTSTLSYIMNNFQCSSYMTSQLIIPTVPKGFLHLLDALLIFLLAASSQASFQSLFILSNFPKNFSPYLVLRIQYYLYISILYLWESPFPKFLNHFSHYLASPPGILDRTSIFSIYTYLKS